MDESQCKWLGKSQKKWERERRGESHKRAEAVEAVRAIFRVSDRAVCSNHSIDIQEIYKRSRAEERKMKMKNRQGKEKKREKGPKHSQPARGERTGHGIRTRKAGMDRRKEEEEEEETKRNEKEKCKTTTQRTTARFKPDRRQTALVRSLSLSWW